MKLRAPAVPLITIDPYFSIWSMGDTLNGSVTRHWTGHPHPLNGIFTVDGKDYGFMGENREALTMRQESLDISSMITTYVFSCAEAKLTVEFFTPLFLEDPAVASRPVSYVHTLAVTADGKVHDFKVTLIVDDALCQNFKYEYPTEYEAVPLDGMICGKVGKTKQRVLGKSGDDLRIDWGYVYAASGTRGASAEKIRHFHEYGTPAHEIKITVPQDDALFLLAYDDIRSIEYFGKQLPSYWNKDGKTIETAIVEANAEYDALRERAVRFDAQLKKDCPTEKYYELLALAYRQAIAAHKIAVDTDGSLLFISKECFSNGCAATVDVTYPSIPLFLIYNPELVKGMLRPIFNYAATDDWFYNFAPHDAGTYPLVNGQIYSHETAPDWQMPVEECGNMLLVTAAVCIAQKDASFAKEHWDVLKIWCEYLIKNGLDPENQLCTDDFAGHLAHNCNLSLKAIMGIAAFGLLNQMNGSDEEYERYMRIAKEMAGNWMKAAADPDTKFRLAFDQPGTYSMKYNAVWDLLFGTGVFPAHAFDAEIAQHIAEHTNRYGMVLDNRAKYTKSDWMLWTAAMTGDEAAFSAIVDRLWDAYNESESRVPMTDFYDTETAKMVGFQNRTVQGGLFIRLLKDKQICRYTHRS